MLSQTERDAIKMHSIALNAGNKHGKPNLISKLRPLFAKIF